MSRLIEEPILPPVLDAHRQPLSFRWRGALYRVERVLEWWKETGRWWDGAPEVKVWRLMIRGGGMVELGQEMDGEKRWILYKIYD